MCFRPDIVYVTSQAVYDDWTAFVDETGWLGDTVGFRKHFTALVKSAEEEGNEQQATHWRNVLDFGFRIACSPFSGIEIDGKVIRLDRMPPEAEEFFGGTDDPIQIYIGNPHNLPHEHGQFAITEESMKAINAAYQLCL